MAPESESIILKTLAYLQQSISAFHDPETQQLLDDGHRIGNAVLNPAVVLTGIDSAG